MFVQEHGALGTFWLYLESFVEPFGTLWFIYLLPIFFVVTKLVHGRVPAWLIWLAAAALEIAPIATGWTVIDEFASRFVYFYTGYLLAPRIFAFAQQAQTFPEAALAFLGAWGLANGVLVFSGYAELPLHLARARARRRRGGRDAGGPDGDHRPAQAAALLRAELDRHLSRLLPADGGEPRPADQARLDQRRRHHLGPGDSWLASSARSRCSGSRGRSTSHSCSSARRASGSRLKETKAKLALQPAR